jgi:PKD repeat protein
MYSVILVPDVIYGWTLPLGWSGMSSSNAINVQANTTSGNVMVSAENACGVSTPSILFVNVTPGGPTASFSYTSQNGVVGFNSGASQNASNWTWDFGDGATSIEANPTHTFGSNGTFEVQLIVSNGCGTDTLIQTVNISGLQVNAIFDQLVQLYPNPFDNELNVELPPVFVGGQIRMLDMNGKELKNVAVKQEKMVLNIDYLDAGCYFVELSDAFMAKKLTVKVFKQ